MVIASDLSNQWGSSRSSCKSESLDDDDKFFHVETMADGDDSVSLMCDPGRNATVLAHNDLAVGGPGVHWVSRGAVHILRSSTCMKIMGASGSFCIPTVWPVACRTTCWGPTQGDPNFF